MNLLETSRHKAQQWLNSPTIDEDSKKEIKKLLDAEDGTELINAFYHDLEFGTGGLRGLMGAGSNCLNRYTVGIATQGLANYLKKSFSGEIKVAIAYDSRNNSSSFASTAAHVFSANGIAVHLFSELRPTPMLSFAIRELGCQSGVVITASHNPKEYNGYKAYWNDGAQLVPPHDKNVIKEIKAIKSFEEVKFAPNASLIKAVSPDAEESYYRRVIDILPNKDIILKESNIPIVYSSLHGSGIAMVPECLKRLGFTNITVVEEQRIPDGNFPTVKSPNPEEHSAMEKAMQWATKVNADCLMATDPDADRVGIGIKDDKGGYFLLNGNQAFSLLMYFLMRHDKNPSEAYIAKTIVTTELLDAMAKQHQVECVNVLTGFKYIAELLREREGKKRFMAAGEESYGYLTGDFVRDKDAVSACAFFAAMAAAARHEGKTLFQWLLHIYCTYGFYKEGLVNVVKKGAEGQLQIKEIMQNFRKNPPVAFCGERVARILDYQSSEEKSNGTITKLNFPTSDVLQFYTEKGTKISVRPSGTEPKIKFYIAVHAPLTSPAEYEKVSLELENKIEAIGKIMVNG